MRKDGCGKYIYLPYIGFATLWPLLVRGAQFQCRNWDDNKFMSHLDNYLFSQGVRICLAATLPYSICSTQHWISLVLDVDPQRNLLGVSQSMTNRIIQNKIRYYCGSYYLQIDSETGQTEVSCLFTTFMSILIFHMQAWKYFSTGGSFFKACINPRANLQSQSLPQSLSMRRVAVNKKSPKNWRLAWHCIEDVALQKIRFQDDLFSSKKRL